MSGQLPDTGHPWGPVGAGLERGTKRAWNRASAKPSPEPSPYASTAAGLSAPYTIAGNPQLPLYATEIAAPTQQQQQQQPFQLPPASSSYYDAASMDSPVSSINETPSGLNLSIYSSSHNSTESIDSPPISSSAQLPHRYQHHPHPHYPPHHHHHQHYHNNSSIPQHPSQAPTSAGLSPNPKSQPSPRESAQPSASTTANSSRNHSSSSFRNVSACKRCRSRKHRCDQRLPACASCEKVGEVCVGYDPFLKREVPRSYVYFLENRVSYLEDLLKENAVPFLSDKEFAIDKGSVYQQPTLSRKRDLLHQKGSGNRIKEELDVNDLVSDVGMVSVKGASDPRYLGSTSGLSFAKVVFAAVKTTARRRSSVDRRKSQSSRAGSRAGLEGEASLRDSVFTLQTKTSVKKAPFPDEELGRSLVELFFEYANCQIPILHRDQFMSIVDRVYGQANYKKTPKEEYLLNMVFAIGSGIIYTASRRKSTDRDEDDDDDDDDDSADEQELSFQHKKARLTSQKSEPEEYHAAAIVHLEHFLEHSIASDHPNGLSSGMEQLQAILLLASFSLLRPVAPGLWYIVGSAVRLALDLGLHSEEGLAADSPSQNTVTNAKAPSEASRGRLQWSRDFRRRLWWCVYAFDRLASSCVGRPCAINDHAITTDFPSLLDDVFITPEGFKEVPEGVQMLSYKLVAYHYFKLRIIQSEIMDVLQFQHAQQSRSNRRTNLNEAIPTHVQSPYLENFVSYADWRTHMEEQLREWKSSAPKQDETGVKFNPLFLELNYWQALIMLYRNSLQTPSVLASDTAFFPTDLPSPSSIPLEDQEDHEQLYVKIAEAGLSVLKIYRKLHRLHLVNYTYLATQHVFMAGISFLYALWHSQTVRSYFTIQDVILTKFAATSVLSDLVDKCPPAETCRDAFSRMSDATMQMWLNTSSGSERETSRRTIKNKKTGSNRPRAASQNTSSSSSRPPAGLARAVTMDQGLGRFQTYPHSVARMAPPPNYDLNVGDLFSEEERLTQLDPVTEQPPVIQDESFLQQLQRMQSNNSVSSGGFDGGAGTTTTSYGPDFSAFSFQASLGGNDGSMPNFGASSSQQPQQQQQQRQYNMATAAGGYGSMMDTDTAANSNMAGDASSSLLAEQQQQMMLGGGEDEGIAISLDEWGEFTGITSGEGLFGEMWLGNSMD